jgi:hypothetical protein
MKRIDSGNKKNIYMATPETELPYEIIDQSNIDQSVVDFIKKYDKDTLVKLR